jgi:glycosyltransferase involved in cell wall biosynthesis
MPGPTLLLVANYDNRVGYAWNNIYRLFNYLGRAFAARGLEVAVSFPSLQPPLTVLDEDIPWRTFVFNPHRVTYQTAAAARREFRRLGVRFVYFTDQKPQRWLYAAMRTWGVQRIVVHSRISVPDPRPAQPTGRVAGIAKRLLARLPMVNADRIYAVSDFVRHRLIVKGGMPAARVRTILNGIEVDRWRCPAPPPSPQCPTFFACARAARYKGIPSLIEAAARLRGVHGIERFRVRFAGDGPDLEAFKKMVAGEQLDHHFEFLGRLEGTRDEVCRADVVVVPSNYGDACPSTVSEGLASGRAVIATRAGGIPELVGDDGNALLVPPGDAAALAEAMATLVTGDERRLELGRRGRRRAEQALRHDLYHRQVFDALVDDLGI